MKRASLWADISEITVLVHWLKDDVGKLLAGVFAMLLKTYKGMVSAFTLMIQEDIADG